MDNGEGRMFFSHGIRKLDMSGEGKMGEGKRGEGGDGMSEEGKS